MVGRNRETFRREDVRPTLKNPSAAGREFFFTRAVYRDGRGWRGESWATDYPKADRVLSEYRAAANLESPHPTLVEFDQRFIHMQILDHRTHLDVEPRSKHLVRPVLWPLLLIGRELLRNR